MKFDMGAETLTTLTRQTQGSSEDLGGLIKQLIASVTPLEASFQGTGRAQFDAFKTHADQVTADLNSARRHSRWPVRDEQLVRLR